MATRSRAFTAATFNAGLAVGVLPHVSERLERIEQRVADLGLDLLCAQEVWLDSHWERLRDAARAELPHALRPPARREAASDLCSKPEVERVLECAGARCADQKGAGLPECMLRRCGDLASELTPSCQACLSRDPTRELAWVERECTLAEPSAGNARGGAAAYLYGGSPGLVVLSRAAPIEQEYIELDSKQVARGVLYMRLPHRNRDIHVFCTHLSTDLPTSYPGAGSWSAEQSRQIDRLLELLEQKSAAGGSVMVLGDLNTGPGAGTGNVARWPEHYARLIGRGLVNPYLDRGPAKCTFCADNPLVSGVRRLVVDHVLLRNFEGPITTERILDETVELELSGQRVRSAYSDHYGIMVKLHRDGA